MAAHDLEVAPAALEAPLQPTLRELVSLIVEQEQRTWLAVVLSASALAGIVMVQVPWFYGAAWITLVVAVTFVHVRNLTRIKLDLCASDEEKLRRIGATFAMHATVLASLLVFFPFVPTTTGTLLTIFVCGVCIATVPTSVGYRPVFLPYSIITLAPVALVWAFSANVEASWFERLMVVLLLIAYFIAVHGQARGTYDAFVRSWEDRRKLTQLGRELRDALSAAESANRAKTRFLASASHDLRQPIHALSLFSGALSLRSLDPKAGAIAQQIGKAVKSLSSQLDALLDISQLDAGVIEKSVAAIDLEAVFLQLREEFAVQAEHKGLRFEMECPPGLPVSTDSVLLLQILRNLLSNAIKYTDAGSVELRAGIVRDECALSVTDSGIGISTAEREKIFEEFYQIGNPERDRAKGLGLGLAIVQRIARLLELHLELRSEPGAGSRFSFRLPLAAAVAPPAPESEAAVEPGLPNLPVLVIDDEETIRLAMKELLEEMGFSVATAESTAQAVVIAESMPPAIVLADFRLRGTDSGIYAIRELRNRWPRLPALLISGDTAPNRLREARDAGLDLLHKPVQAKLLREAILKAAERREE